MLEVAPHDKLSAEVASALQSIKSAQDAFSQFSDALTKIIAALEAFSQSDSRATPYHVEAVKPDSKRDGLEEIYKGECFPTRKEAARRLGVTETAIHLARRKYREDWETDRGHEELAHPGVPLQRGSFIIRGVQLVCEDDIKD